MAKPTTAQILMRVLWPRLQAGERSFLIEDTQASYGLTAQQLSKAVRRFNENGHKLQWPGLHFSATIPCGSRRSEQHYGFAPIFAPILSERKPRRFAPSRLFSCLQFYDKKRPLAMRGHQAIIGIASLIRKPHGVGIMQCR